MSEKSEIPLRSCSTSQQPLFPASPSPFVRFFFTHSRSNNPKQLSKKRRVTQKRGICLASAEVIQQHQDEEAEKI